MMEGCAEGERKTSSASRFVCLWIHTAVLSRADIYSRMASEEVVYAVMAEDFDAG